MIPNILTRIADKRRARIVAEGYGLSCVLPELRELPHGGAGDSRAGEAAGAGHASAAGQTHAAGKAPVAGKAAAAGQTPAAGKAAGPGQTPATGKAPAAGQTPATGKAARAGKAAGPGQTHAVPGAATTPGPAAAAAPLPFLPNGGIICEIKRRSPSRGDISEGLDPLAQAGLYVERGADAVSILTEEDSFGGCIADLATVKTRFPELPLLRKDFLLDVHDVEISYRAGADAVLLIAALLSEETLAEMHAAAVELGMAALVEVHNEREVEAVSALRPPLVGINARDLSTFHVDPLTPVRLRPSIDWPARVVYESGVFEAEQAAVAASAGFDSVLVGEAVVRDPERVDRIRTGLAYRNWQVSVRPSAGAGQAGRGSSAAPGEAAATTDTPTTGEPIPAVGPRSPLRPAFWPRLAARMTGERPLVKICGITRREDAAEAVRLGADLLGFVFAKSPRMADAQVVRECRDLDCLKVAVVVSEKGESGLTLPEPVATLLAEGALDAVQFHGDEPPESCAALAFPYYKALRLRSPDDVQMLDDYHCPRVLVDAFSREARGGTGCTIAPETASAVSDRGPLWLAGGLNPETIAAAVVRHEPELVDASSGLEAEPGRKDHNKLESFFREIRNA